VREFLEKTIVGAGEICLNGVRDNSSDSVRFKGPKDLVTIVDQRVEEYIVRAIRHRFPSHDIVGEEGGSQLAGSDFCWYIDPIDGTTSYFHRQPYYAVSIALKKEGIRSLAGVYAPELRQLFLAEKGKGATLNGRLIQVSNCAILENAVLATGFACLRSGHEHNNLYYLNKILPQIRDIRRCGSAAIDMAYVAAGKYDGFWELNLNEYDIAAGALLVEEAGGRVCDFQGGSDFPEQGVVAANQTMRDTLLALLAMD